MVTASLFVFTEVAIELALGAGANVALLIWAYTLHEGHEVDEDGRQG